MNCQVGLSGRLGNNLFQVATCVAHCKRYGYEPSILYSEHGYCSENHRRYWDTILHKMKDCRTTTKLQGEVVIVYDEPEFQYRPIPPPARYLGGYFQSAKYFHEFATEIRELFRMPDVIVRTVDQKYRGLLEMKENIAVIHVRRTDYTHDMKFGWVTLDYYRAAMEQMKQRHPGVHFLIFSDDIPWCQEQAVFADAFCVNEPDEILSFELMRRFSHFIITNSTFSWWAAWLSEDQRTVMTPHKWFRNSEENWTDIIEPHWIRVLPSA